MQIIQVILAGILLAGFPVLCARAEGLSQGKTEVSGYGGFTHVRDGGSETKAQVGGLLAFGLSGRSALYLDFGYTPLGGGSASGVFEGVPVAAKASGKLFSFEGGMNIHLAPSDARAVPYLLAGAGFGRASAEVSASTPGYSFSMSESETGGIAGGGLGVRLYLGDRWGLKPEFKVQRTFGLGDNVTLFRFAVGIFYQFGK